MNKSSSAGMLVRMRVLGFSYSTIFKASRHLHLSGGKLYVEMVKRQRSYNTDHNVKDTAITTMNIT